MKVGRRTKYKKNFPKRAYEYALKGLSDQQIAKNLNISVGQFYEYKKKYPEFTEAIKNGKAPADEEIENRLYSRAIGYDYEETSTEVEVGKDGQARATKIKTIKKHMAPDVAAQIFWLKNRKPSEWTDKRINEVGGIGGEKFEPITVEVIDNREQVENTDDKGI